MATVQNLIESGLRLIGALSPGESATTTELADSLIILNELLESLSLERLLIQANTRTTHDLTAGIGDYTIGPSGQFNVTRYTDIENAGVVILPGSDQPIEYPLHIYRTEDEWARVGLKSLTGIPKTLYYRKEFPKGRLLINPLPESSVYDLVLYGTVVLTAFATTAETYSLAPGYGRMLRYNFAVDAAPEFGLSIPPEVALVATQSKASIKLANLIVPVLECDSALVLGDLSNFDIESGGFLN